MDKKIVFWIGACLLCCSGRCTQPDKRVEDLPYYTVKNKVLEKQIIDYIDSIAIPEGGETMVKIEVEPCRDTVIYTMSLALNYFDYIREENAYDPEVGMTIFLKVRGTTVSMSFAGMKSIENFPGEKTWPYIKEIFKTTYKQYMEKKYHPDVWTGTSVAWVLTFVNEELVDKQVIDRYKLLESQEVTEEEYERLEKSGLLYHP